MTHDQLIERLHKLVEKLDGQARASKDLARETYDPDDPFCELRSADDPIWHRGCGTGLSSAARELSWLLGEFDPERKRIDYHCDCVRSYARLYNTTLAAAFLDYEGEGVFHALPALRDKIRAALGISTPAEHLAHY